MLHTSRVSAAVLAALLALFPAACANMQHLAPPPQDEVADVQEDAAPELSSAAMATAVRDADGAAATYATAEEAIGAGDAAGLLTLLAAMPYEERENDTFANSYLALDRAAARDFAGARAYLGLTGDPETEADLRAGGQWRRCHRAAQRRCRQHARHHRRPVAGRASRSGGAYG
ncbi:MAG: hypothetical protein B7X53_13255 [Hyphomonas sp. 34-62-18]|nr:hypothetical protein [Hyphomonas sp. 34-62-18]OZB14694.1 MAG: hypothetical protein B7X53_13255 [Hyphomonas sp. 34-62-18]